MEKSNLEKVLNLYNYNLPEKLIAKKPASPRDSARLLVYNKKINKIIFDKFYNLDKYLPNNAVLVLNQTKVLPARLELKKESGGKVKILYLGYNNKNNLIEVLSDRKLQIGSELLLNSVKTFKVVEKKEKIYLLKLTTLKYDDRSFLAEEKMLNILQKYGKTPIPPYIKNSPLSEKQLRKEYQTIFAKNLGSVAAPTASLHFTKKVFIKLKKKGVSIKFINLDVGLGTFAPLDENNLKSKKLHKEFYNINKETAEFLNNAKKQKRLIIGVGTTVVRTLESATAPRHCEEVATDEAIQGESDSRLPRRLLAPRNDGYFLKNLSGATQLFIQENYKFKFVDSVVTNFHVPKSSLLMMISALTGREKLLDIYNIAIKNNFKFYSFGDGMLII